MSQEHELETDAGPWNAFQGEQSHTHNQQQSILQSVNHLDKKSKLKPKASLTDGSIDPETEGCYGLTGLGKRVPLEKFMREYMGFKPGMTAEDIQEKDLYNLAHMHREHQEDITHREEVMASRKSKVNEERLQIQ